MNGGMCGSCARLQKVALEVEDHTKFDGWLTVNKHAFQTEVIEYLAWEKATVSARVVCCVALRCVVLMCLVFAAVGAQGPIAHKKASLVCCAQQ